MTDTIKKYLGVVGIIALAVVSVSAWRYTDAYSRSIDPSAIRSFSVQGDGKVLAKPDVASFNFGVITEGGMDINALQKENTDKANKILEFINSSGVEKKDVQTENYSISPRYQYYSCPASPNSIVPCPQSKIIGYTVSQTVSVKVRDFNKTGDLLSGVASRGANNVSGIQFTVDDLSKVQNDARAKAIEKAKQKAKDIADAGGFKLGRLISIEEGVSPSPVPYAYKSALGMGAADSAAASPVIEPGSQDVTVNVTLRYEIR